MSFTSDYLKKKQQLQSNPLQRGAPRFTLPTTSSGVTQKASTVKPAATKTAAGSSTSTQSKIGLNNLVSGVSDRLQEIKKSTGTTGAQTLPTTNQKSGSVLDDIKWGLGYGSERVLGGFVLKPLEAISDTIGSAGSKALEYITSFGYSRPNDVSEFWRKQAENYLSTSPTEDYKRSIEKRYKPTDAQRKLGDFEETVASILPSLAASYLTGGGSSAAQLGSSGASLLPTGSNLGRTIMGVQAAGGGAQQAYQEGATVGEALTFGAASGALETATEALVGGVPGLGKGAASELISKVVSNPLVRRSIDVVGEGGEEAISTIVTPYLKRAIYDTSAENASLDEIAESAVMGMAAAGVLQAGLSLPTSFSNRIDTTRQANANLNNPEFVERTTSEAIQNVNRNLNRKPFTLPSVQAQDAVNTQPAPSVQTQPETTVQRRQGVQVPIETRTWQDAGNRKVNAFQYDHPELHPYYAEAARALKYDLASSVKGERMPIYDASSGTRDIIGYTGTKRSVTDPIAQALDNGNLSYAQIDKAIDDLIADNGQENYAAAKKLELVLDDMLTNGYTDSDGYDVPPNQAYPEARERANNGGTEYSMSEDEWNSLMSQEPADDGFLLPMVNGPESSVGAARKGFDPWSAFQGTKSEFFPEGANAARPVDVPTTDAEGNPIRKTASTAMGAKAIPDEVVGDIQNMVMSGDLSYKRVTDRDSTARAVSRIQNDGFQRALGDFSDAVQKGVVSKDLATLGQQLLINATNAGDANATAELLSLYAQMETVAGQAVQAASILRKLSPTAQLYAAQKAVDNLNKTIGKKKGSRPSAEENVPVEIWMQRVGENLADELSSRVNAPKDKAKSVSETILSDLRKFANESAPKRLQTGKKRSNIDRIVDLFQNKDAYNEAWQAAKDTLSDNFENNPEALSAFEEWLDSSLDYSKMLTKELTGQTEIAIPQNLVEEFLQQTDQAGRDIVLDKIYQNIADQVQSTWKDKWNAWRYLAMLGNPRTHVRNVVGNVGFQPVRYTKDRIAALIESGVNAASGGKLQRTKSFAYNHDLYSAAWQDYDNVADVLGGNKYDDVQSIINDKRTIFKTKPLEAARRGNSNLLGIEDMWFKRITYADALAGYLNANGVTAEQLKNGTVDSSLMSAARDYAGQEALKATYNDKNVVSNKVVQAAKSLGTFGEAVLPFKRTPANIFVRGVEYSPVGLAKGLTYDLYKVKNGEMTGAQAIDNIAAGMTGSGLMLLGAMLAASGIVTGGAGEDDKQAEFNELTGGQTYALNLPGGGSVTLDWLAPEALPFFMGVQAMQSFGEEGLTGDTITSAFASISEPMLEMSMLQSLNDLIDNVSYAASNEKLSGLVGSSLISYLTQAIPTIGGQIERTFEDKRYSTYTNKDSLLPTDVQYALGKASAKIPGWDFQQVPYIDAWGREEETGLLPMRALNNFLNPAYTSSLNVTPVDEEIQRLYNSTGIGSVIPSRADKSITVNGEDINLSGDKYVEYAKAKGETAFDLLSSIIDTSAYKGLSDDEKVKLISDVYEYANSVGKAAVSNYKLDGFSAKVQSTGVDPADYILYRSTADQDGNDSVTQSESASALLPMKNLTTTEKGKVWQSQNSSWSEKKNPFTGALASAGIDASTATSILNKYSEVYNMDIEAGEQAAELSKFLDGLDLTTDQRAVVDDTYKFYNMFPAKIKAYSIDTMSSAAQSKWPRVQAWGMPEEDYLKYYPMISSGKKAECIQKLVDAGMTQNDANTFWRLVKNK